MYLDGTEDCCTYALALISLGPAGSPPGITVVRSSDSYVATITEGRPGIWGGPTAKLPEVSSTANCRAKIRGSLSAMTPREKARSREDDG
jgi:hypothetical protein